jgi:hypothetical protein
MCSATREMVRSLRHWSSWLSALPTTDVENPHCVDPEALEVDVRRRRADAALEVLA